MKKQNPLLKVMLSVLCMSNDCEFANVVETKSSRERFVLISLFKITKVIFAI